MNKGIRIEFGDTQATHRLKHERFSQSTVEIAIMAETAENSEAVQKRREPRKKKALSDISNLLDASPKKNAPIKKDKASAIAILEKSKQLGFVRRKMQMLTPEKRKVVFGNDISIVESTSLGRSYFYDKVQNKSSWETPIAVRNRMLDLMASLNKKEEAPELVTKLFQSPTKERIISTDRTNTIVSPLSLSSFSTENLLLRSHSARLPLALGSVQSIWDADDAVAKTSNWESELPSLPRASKRSDVPALQLMQKVPENVFFTFFVALSFVVNLVLSGQAVVKGRIVHATKFARDKIATYKERRRENLGGHTLPLYFDKVLEGLEKDAEGKGNKKSDVEGPSLV